MVTFSPPTHTRRTRHETSTVPTRTSETHPMNVSWVARSTSGGRFGLTYCPGKTVNRGGVRWCRDLDTDLDRLKNDFGVTTILCLLSQAELLGLRLRHYAEGVKAKGLHLITFPIVEMAAPDSFKKTTVLIELIEKKLSEGEVMIIHCRGGVGRAGLIAACLLLKLRMASSAADAISKIRKLRCRTAVESYCQEQFIAKYNNFIRSKTPPLISEVKWEVFQKKNASTQTFFVNSGPISIQDE